jgi:VanZ family protein
VIDGARLAGACRLLLLLALAVTTWQTLTPNPPPLPGENSDKLVHAGVFLVLALLTDFAWPGRPIGWRALMLLALYGAGIEIAQHFAPPRTMSAADLAADVAGLALYALLIGPWLRRATADT